MTTQDSRASDSPEESRRRVRVRVRWRNVFLLCALGSPVALYAGTCITPPCDAPRITSPEGRKIFREFLQRVLPELAGGKGVSR